MKIIDLRVNHLTQPIGFHMNDLYFTYKVINTNSKFQKALQVHIATDIDFNQMIFDSGKDESITTTSYKCNFPLIPRTKYFWRVTVWDENNQFALSEPTWFETGKMDEAWEANWITSDFEQTIHPVIEKDISCGKILKSARLYICGLGLYEAYLNGGKIGHEYLSPGNHNYHNWLQYQTYDITEQLNSGENSFSVKLGDGWYKGNFGFNGGMDNIFGDSFALISEIHLTYQDGSHEVIGTDETWKSYESNIRKSGIYLGEVLDETFVPDTKYGVRVVNLNKMLLEDRRSVPVIVKEKMNPVRMIRNDLGETILDMGQNMVGWITFKNKLSEGQSVTIQYGEILQNGQFYRENLRHAKAEFQYTSDGKEKWVRPHFTFYGFRYAKIIGFGREINLEDFMGEVLYSDLEQIGHIETSDPKVKRLFFNALWSQKGNFLDIPTDCPQRDERMGWTGDAQVFSATAAYNMGVYPFYRKYGYDLALEQAHLSGAVPMTVPHIPNPTMGNMANTSSAWGDAATIIPWNMYLFTGDKTVLESQFKSMCAWVDYIYSRTGEEFLWNKDFHFGDWLALDGENANLPNGGTEPYFIASAYYYYSTSIVSKTAEILGHSELARNYSERSEKIKMAIQNEYISPNGKLTIDKQTAYVLALYMDLIDEKHQHRVASNLVERLKKDEYQLKTGFVGTPYICKVLSKYGYNDIAYTLLLNEDYPSWLYAVNLGATTIWERWNSVLSDGSMNPQGMNSLNHYAYGSIAEWMYAYMLGIQPLEGNPGFYHTLIAPKPNWRMKKVKGEYNSVAGLYRVKWEIQKDGKLDFYIHIPFNAKATVVLPDCKEESIIAEGNKQVGDELHLLLTSGEYHFSYYPVNSYVKSFNRYTNLEDLINTVPTKKIIFEELPEVKKIKHYKLPMYLEKNLDELKVPGLLNISEERIEKIDQLLKSI